MSLKDSKWWREYRAKNRDKLRAYERERKRISRLAVKSAKIADVIEEVKDGKPV